MKQDEQGIALWSLSQQKDSESWDRNNMWTTV